MTTSGQIIRDAVGQAVKSGRSFHDYWYYTMEHSQRMLFQGFQEFEARGDRAYKNELERRDDTC